VSRSSPWAVCLRRRPRAALRLFCFPHAGGGPANFRGWADEMPESIEVWPVHLPGRERRIAEEPIPSIAGLVAAMTEGLRDLLDGRFALFGHSMGALLSFELTRQLRRQGLAGPRCLAVSGFGAPHIPSIRAPIGHLPDVEFLAELHRLQGTPPGVLDDPELVELLLPVLRADFLAVETYCFEADTPLTCPIFAYGGASDTEVPGEHLVQWDLHTSGAFATRLFRGDHFYLHSRRAELIANLARDLTGAGTSTVIANGSAGTTPATALARELPNVTYCSGSDPRV
jgi:medium-chain acyl-[acyl-carrier-protein] hydrolase